jgi:hypothetical protein
MNTNKYDLEVLLPLSAKGKYQQRMQDFQKTGLLNHHGQNLHVTLLIGTEEAELFTAGWSYPVTLR